jgi:hypothetical protein
VQGRPPRRVERGGVARSGVQKGSAMVNDKTPTEDLEELAAAPRMKAVRDEVETPSVVAAIIAGTAKVASSSRSLSSPAAVQDRAPFRLSLDLMHKLESLNVTVAPQLGLLVKLSTRNRPAKYDLGNQELGRLAWRAIEQLATEALRRVESVRRASDVLRGPFATLSDDEEGGARPLTEHLAHRLFDLAGLSEGQTRLNSLPSASSPR